MNKFSYVALIAGSVSLLACGPAEPKASEADQDIPEEFWGRWTDDVTMCSQSYYDSEITINADLISFYESLGTVVDVIPNGKEFIIKLSMRGEGSTWQNLIALSGASSSDRISIDGNLYYKCESPSEDVGSIDDTPLYVEETDVSEQVEEMASPDRIIFLPWRNMPNATRHSVEMMEEDSLDRISGALVRLNEKTASGSFDAIFSYNSNSGWCGSAGCPLTVYYTSPGAGTPTEILSVVTGAGGGEEGVSLGKKYTRGMRNILLDGQMTWVWDGKYYVPK